jgi:hypothetical protein
MKKRFLLYKMQKEDNSFLYLRDTASDQKTFTYSPAKAKKFNFFSAWWLGLIYNLKWIDVKYTFRN